MNSTPAYPVLVEGLLEPGLSRWRWLVKWLLLIPHYILLSFLWAALAVLSVVAWFAILVTGHYPRRIFDFNIGVLRWSWRVAFYSYNALGTDRYPPFTLADVTDYPARLQITYPERLSRGLVLVKSWLLAVPHLLLLGFFLGGGAYVTGRGDRATEVSWGSGVVGLLVLFAAVALLVTKTYPRGVFDLVLGLDRWALRVAAYVLLMTDVYPPFRLDQGGGDPAGPAAPQPAAPAGGGVLLSSSPMAGPR